MSKLIEGPIQEALDSKYLPDHLRDRYAQYLNDPELTHLRRHIALLDVRQSILMENLDRLVLGEAEIAEELQAEFPHLKPADIEKLARYTRALLPDSYVDYRTYRRLEQLVDSYETNIRNASVIKADKALRQLFSYIRDGRREGDIWKDIEEVMDKRRRMSEAEESRMAQAQQTLNIDKVILLLGITIQALREAVVRYVADKEIQEYILADAERIYTERLSGGGDSQGDAEHLDGDDLRRSLSSVR